MKTASAPPGEVPYEQIMQHPERHSKAVMKDLYRTPGFCAACHKANLPNPLNNYKFLRAFTVYDEWQNSTFSKRNPLTFYSGDFTTCQSCHMTRVPAVGQEYRAKKAHLLRIAGWLATVQYRFIMASTSN